MFNSKEETHEFPTHEKHIINLHSIVNKVKIRSQETGQEAIEESGSGVMRNKPGLS